MSKIIYGVIGMLVMLLVTFAQTVVNGVVMPDKIGGVFPCRMPQSIIDNMSTFEWIVDILIIHWQIALFIALVILFEFVIFLLYLSSFVIKAIAYRRNAYLLLMYKVTYVLVALSVVSMLIKLIKDYGTWCLDGMGDFVVRIIIVVIGLVFIVLVRRYLKSISASHS